jgi:murein DD-endopeptidase MepM/ murein hydrolase activator NlpD
MVEKKIDKIKNEYYTVLVIPEHESATMSYKVKSYFIKLFLLLTAVILMMICFFIYKNYNYIDKAIAFDKISEENKKLREQSDKLQDFFVELEKLKHYRLETIKAINADENKLSTQLSNDSLVQELFKTKRKARTYMDIAEVIYEAIPSISPIKNPVVSKSFELNTKERSGHLGVDIAATIGTEIHCTADGVVVFSDWTVSYGFTIIIQHAYGIRTVYKHNQYSKVVSGQKVNKNEVIAFVGNTGKLTSGAHLHFEVWRGEDPIDPTYLITDFKGKVY